MTADMHSLPSFSLLVLLLCSAVAVDDDWDDWFSTTSTKICPGQSFTIPGATVTSFHDNLFFQSGVRGSRKVQISNNTHVFDPSYEKKKKRVVIPEVKRQHEGTYIWESSLMPGLASKRAELVLKDCSAHIELVYGLRQQLAVPKDAVMLEFTPSGSKDQKILWSRINAEDERGARGTISQNRWTANKMRFADAGRYAFLRESGSEISSYTVKIREFERHHNVDDLLSVQYKIEVPVSEAVVTFIDPSKTAHVIFMNGMMTEDALRIFTNRVWLSTELDVLVFALSGTDSGMIGRYEVTEKKGRAFVIHVYAGSRSEPPTIPDRTVPIAAAASILTLFIFCCCVRRCCCKKKGSSPPAPAPSALPVYRHEPAPGPRPAYQPVAAGPVGGTIDTPAAPSYSSPPTSYAALSAKGPEPYVPYVPYQPPEGPTGAYGAPVIPTPAAPSAPSAPDYQYQPRGWSTTDILNTSPLSMDTTDTRAPDGAATAAPSAPSAPDYQYQPRGWTGTMGDFLTASPLNTDTTDHTEYSSAKLNF